ncbi:MAG: cytochrome oxidase putative small subunit CydP [Dokdonella sp.]
MTTDNPSTRSWFRHRDGRKFILECAVIIVAKLVVLIAIWYVCFRPFPRADTSPAAVEKHLLASPSQSVNPAHD